jgi:hypothetical protein
MPSESNSDNGQRFWFGAQQGFGANTMSSNLLFPVIS